MDVLYTAEAVSTGQGRLGHVTAGTYLDLDVAPPKELGGSGAGTNPEQLFAAGYAACFHSALHSVARARKVTIEDSSVGGRVHIGPNGQGGYQLAVLLEVVLPGIEHDLAQQLADEAHQVCPYSNATRGNIEVTVTVSED
ncbi:MULTISPECIES: organic hydroperoxide resistance protein [Microbacterium]|uniref:Stress-induced protein n=1 Tax=Microbacterium testaceum TaxID=2033 RepID=A0A4Y3QGN8_MICTE|nr:MULTISPECIES: organic hydroperoxide resistance protein [Microbacterium]MDZ5145830.1 organic hydroperoxide resistance protein [Microbacterium testaceum]PNW09785.1 organic hydroperoxide resistance protein [Microbacterium testaceum]REC99793.1 Ohr subfamily peroxiredoxin [Microbacterium sp. AG157]WJS91494.1 organic hydroperoxide resistance protein [Microbacterium testaceum]GEB44137.1 stress-induced protein [Microbacterium testaceum]